MIMKREKVKSGASNQPPMASCLSLYGGCVCLVKVLGLDYIWEVLRDLLGNDTNKGDPVRLDDEVKSCVIKFLDKLESNMLDEKWKSFPLYNPHSDLFLPHGNRDPLYLIHIVNCMAEHTYLIC